MNSFLRGFTSEIVKTAKVGGLLRRIGRFGMKHPLLSLSAIGTAAATGGAALSAYRQGLRGGERPRYLAADQTGASPVAYTNYHQLLERKPRPREIRALSKHYNESKFKR